jgi:tRNA threonylcarbamoyladenosine biosynthesis protein TsaE
MIEISLPDLDATTALAGQIAPFLEAGDVVGLEGSLGAGQTTFARDLIGAMAAHHGADPVGEVPSPTFTLVQVYETGAAPVWHFDLYRLRAPEDALELGIEEAFSEAISLIEWPSKLGNYMPHDWLEIRLEIKGEFSRHGQIIGHGLRGEAIETAFKEGLS